MRRNGYKCVKYEWLSIVQTHWLWVSFFSRWPNNITLCFKAKEEYYCKIAYISMWSKSTPRHAVEAAIDLVYHELKVRNEPQELKKGTEYDGQVDSDYSRSTE